MNEYFIWISLSVTLLIACLNKGCPLSSIKGLGVDLATEYRKQVELAHLQKIFLDNHQHLYTICPPITREQVENTVPWKESVITYLAFAIPSNQLSTLG